MNGKKNGSATKNRSYRNIRIAPTTRAIRTALALSATVLALSGSGTAFAACALTATDQVTCNGVFVNDVAADPVVIANAGPDLTLIVGDDLATTVDPAGGINGITSDWGGNATVITYAEINTSGADGIYMYSDDIATINNHGSIYSEVTGAGQEAIDVTAVNNVYVTNDGDIEAGSSGSYDVTGITATSYEGAVSITNDADGSIVGDGTDGYAIGVLAIGGQGVTVDNAGLVRGSTFSGLALGVGGVSKYNGTTIDNSGTIEAFGLDGYSLGALGISIFGDVDITSSGMIETGGSGIAGAILGASLYGDVTIDNSGTIDVLSTGKYAGGIVAATKYETAVTTVINSGDMTVEGELIAGGILAIGVGDVYVDNSGTMDITAGNGIAQGVAAASKYGDANVDNSGTLSVVSNGYYSAAGITAYAAYDANVDNSGSIYVSGFYSAMGIYAVAEGYATVTTAAGSYIEAQGYYAGLGIVAEGYAGATVDSAGNVYAYAGGAALFGDSFASFGIIAYSDGGNADVTNSGSVEAVTYAYTYGGTATATGIYALSDYDASVTNSGTVTADANAYAFFGVTAVGIDAMAPYGDATVTNSGTVEAIAFGYGYFNGVTAYGISGYSVDGNVSITNSGSASASATNDPNYGAFLSYGAMAYGISGYSVYGDVAVDNSGTVTATATDTYYNFFENRADGIYAGSLYGDVSVDNSGTVSASASSVYGYYGNSANGIYAAAYHGSTSVTNSGSVSATVSGYTYYAGYFSNTSTAIGINAYAYYGDTTVDNSGTVSAESTYGNAIGVLAYSSWGIVDVTNSGDIDVTANGTYHVGDLPDEYIYVSGQAVGVLALGYYDVNVANSGNIDVSGFVFADGIDAFTHYGDLSVDNSGTITAHAGPDYYFAAYATGIYAYNEYESVTVTNSGLIDVTAAAGSGVDPGEYTILGSSEATGVYAQSYGDGTVLVDNSGTISATATSYALFYGPTAIGVNAYSEYGEVEVNNSGLIEATARANLLAKYAPAVAIGVTAFQVGYYSNEYGGSVLVDNSGTITADASAYYGSAGAAGVYAVSIYGDLDVTSSGSISAAATSGDYSAFSVADATGIAALNYSAAYYYGNVNVANSGTIDVTATTGVNTYYSSAIAVGITAESTEGAVTVDNSGTINVTATAGIFGAGDYAYAYDNQADAYGIVAYSYDGDISVLNSGDVNVTAIAGGYVAYANATGIGAIIGVDGYGDIGISNDGNVVANAQNIAVGIQAQSYGGYYGGYVDVGNTGSVEANAVGAYDPVATGVEIDATYAIFHNDGGSIHASAVSGYDYGFVLATGVHIDAVNVGYYAYSEEEEAYVFYSGFHNDGDISAYASGYEGDSVGAYVHSYYGLLAYNDGDISAEAAGAYVEAVGFFAGSDVGGVTLVNTGGIYASSEYLATGVWLGSDLYTSIFNYGTIEAGGSAYNYAIDTSYGASEDYIYNAGTITGGIRAGAGDDYLYNSVDGTWDAYYSLSDFGDGDDGIVNYGLIEMEYSYIDLGYHDVTGNFFYNYGTIAVQGIYNEIHMGHGPAGPVVPSLNPLAFYNGIGGTIDFQDGAADDMLTIVGDFAGDGDINVDVSGLTGYSDILYIDGSVVEGTAGVINVNLLDLPDVIESLIPIVYVSGDSVDGNFVLGDVNWDEDNAFVTLDFGIVADIDASNADPDVFSLGIEVTGLSDPGTLAASIAPSALSLINTQVGTWRQRMGVIDSFNKQAIALWARVFSNEGSFQPDHSAVNFGPGGNFDWEQKNSGVEAGADFAVTDEFSLGFLLAQSQADTDLEAGNGSADIDADTWGVYGTWISPNGWYLDASYRWTDFEVDMNSSAGGIETEGDAETFNIEVGYAWTLSGGLKIEPQLQYTKTRVDNISVLETTTGMSFEYDTLDSSRGRLGVAIRKGFGEADTGWLWTPYAALSVVREFDGEVNYSINESFFGQSTLDGTSVLVELGFTARHQNWAVYGGLNFEDGGSLEGFFGGQLGVRYTFASPAPAPVPVVVPAKTCAELDDDGDGVNNCDDKCLGSTAGEAVGPDGCPVPPPVMEPKPFRG